MHKGKSFMHGTLGSGLNKLITCIVHSVGLFQHPQSEFGGRHLFFVYENYVPIHCEKRFAPRISSALNYRSSILMTDSRSLKKGGVRLQERKTGDVLRCRTPASIACGWRPIWFFQWSRIQVKWHGATNAFFHKLLNKRQVLRIIDLAWSRMHAARADF